MPYYEYYCTNNKCSKVIEEFHKIREAPNSVECPSCGFVAEKAAFPSRFQVNTFKPYVEENFNGKPVHITSAKQRDELCKKHGATYDSNKYFRKPKREAAADDLTLGKVKEVLDKGVLPDGSKLEKPSKIKADKIPTRVIK